MPTVSGEIFALPASKYNHATGDRYDMTRYCASSPHEGPNSAPLASA